MENGDSILSKTLASTSQSTWHQIQKIIFIIVTVSTSNLMFNQLIDNVVLGCDVMWIWQVGTNVLEKHTVFIFRIYFIKDIGHGQISDLLLHPNRRVMKSKCLEYLF